MPRLHTHDETLHWALDSLNIAPGVVLPIRMTVIRLPDGSVLLHSPIPIDDALAAEIEAVGPVRHLVAPSCFHHLYLGHAHERWPDATTYAAPKLAKKRPDLTLHHTLTDTPPEAWDDALDVRVLPGIPAVNEALFYHRPTRTLIVTDLIFNLQRPEGALAPIVFRLFGTYKKAAVSRLFRSTIKDRASLAAALRDLLTAWTPIDRVLVAHGDPLEGPDAARLAEIFAVI